jgi:predicted NAD/FAD-binding protein
MPVTRVERDATGVWIHTLHGSERFDEVVLATHSDQALRLLGAPTAQEVEVLSPIKYHPNRAVLHTDASVMPQRAKAWAAWNYERGIPSEHQPGQVCLHYWLNRLQPLPFKEQVFVSLNPLRDIRPERILLEMHYEHPVFDLAAIAAQQRVPAMQGVNRTWFAGAWMGYGFHEDGLCAAQSVVRHWTQAHGTQAVEVRT